MRILYFTFLLVYLINNNINESYYKLKFNYEIKSTDAFGDNFYLIHVSDYFISNTNSHLFVLDGEEQCIYEFNKTGKFERKIGRFGKGPGEFLGAYDIEQFGNDGILVADNGNRRFTKIDLFDLKTAELSYPSNIRIVRKFKVDNTNNIFVENIENKIMKSDMLARTFLFKFDSLLNLIRVIDSTDYYKERFNLANSKVKVRYPYPNKMIWGLLENIVFVGQAYSNELKIYNNNTVGKIEFAQESSLLSQADKESYLSENYFLQYNGEWEKGAPQEVRNQLVFPKYLPKLYNLIVDELRGTILLQVSSEVNEKYKYALFNYSMKTVEKIKLPSKIYNKNTLICNNTLVVNMEVERDFPILRVYQLTDLIKH